MSQLVEFGPFRLDLRRHLLFRGEEPISVPSKALDTLVELVGRHGEVVSKDELLAAVWQDSVVEEGNLSQNIYVLRKVLGEAPDEHRYIVTIPGKGYRFVAPVRVLEGPPGLVDQRNKNPKSPSPTTRDAQPVQKSSRLRDFFRRNKPWVLALSLIAPLLLIGLLLLAQPLARSFNNQGVLMQKRGRLSEAVRRYQRAILLQPNYAEAHYNLGDAYEEIPDYSRALEQYQRAIDASPAFYPAYNNLARLYILRLKDPEAAMRLLDHALGLEPKEVSVLYTIYKNYGWANFELQQLGQAEQNLRHAISLDHDRGSAHCLLAKVLDAQGKKGEAASQWETCIAFASQLEVEPEWRNQAKERLQEQMRK
jgi:DNA-binding winged helix-turn-helix (wHTH) protein/Flp pilus assembly protein TadD